MTVTVEARATLAAALTATFADTPVTVTSTVPTELAVPACFVDAADRRMTDDDGAAVVVVTFPVYLIVDGADQAQVDALDGWGDLIWSTILDLAATPTASTTSPFDVGGPRLRTTVTLCDVPVHAITLCEEKYAA